MDTSLVMPLFVIMGCIVFCILAGLGLMFFLKKRKEKQKKFSLPIAGSDRSDYAERLAEKFRNERLNEE